MKNIPRTIEWLGGLDGCVQMVDQTLLPGELKLIQCHDAACVREAIQVLRVRGAPAIGIAGAMGLVLAVRALPDEDEAYFFDELERRRADLAAARPTAVNLAWALDRLAERAKQLRGSGVVNIQTALLDEAKAIRDEDARSCRAIGAYGAFAGHGRLPARLVPTRFLGPAERTPPLLLCWAVGNQAGERLSTAGGPIGGE